MQQRETRERPRLTRELAEAVVARLREWRCGWCGCSMTRAGGDGSISQLDGCPPCEWVWPVQGPAVDARRDEMIAELMKCPADVVDEARS
jgi:hypothetical protein